MVATIKKIPSIGLPFTDSEGRINPVWYEFFRSFITDTGTVVGSDGAGSTTEVNAGSGLRSVTEDDGSQTLSVGAGSGLAVNANDVAIDISSLAETSISLDDKVMLLDVSDNNSNKKTEVRNLMALASPGGSSGQVQYNSNGGFEGDSGFTTNGAGSVDITGDLDVDNININGNTIITTNTDGDLNITPNGTGETNVTGNVALGNDVRFYWAGGSPTTYSIGGAGGTPSIQGQSTAYQFNVTGAGWSMGVGSGSTVIWSSSTGAMTITGLTLKMADNYISRYTVAGIVASTTQSQGQGPLTGDINEVATVANVDDTVTLPLAVAGRQCLVINNGANQLQVFPASGDDLGAGVNTATTISAASRKLFVAYDGVNWEPVL